jgi:hypothetical protein
MTRIALEGRERAERFSVTLFEVVQPSVAEIVVHQMWDASNGDGQSGGASFAQRCEELPVIVTTSLVRLESDSPMSPSRSAVALRPRGPLGDWLRETRRPEGSEQFGHDDWGRWIEEMETATEDWILDDARWSSAKVLVDDVLTDGVTTHVGESFSLSAIYLAEGRLDVSVEHLQYPVPQIETADLRIVRSNNLDRVTWDPD